MTTIDAGVRCQVMDRLQSEGRRETALAFKEKTRQRLRSEGVGREEAKNRAWELMVERFPPVDIDAYCQAMLLSDDFCPALADEHQADCYYVLCRMAAWPLFCHSYILPDFIDVTEARVASSASGLPDNAFCPTAETQRMFDGARADLAGFFDHAEGVLLHWRDGLPADDPRTDTTRAELTLFLDALPHLRDIAGPCFEGADAMLCNLAPTDSYRRTLTAWRRPFFIETVAD